MEKIFLSQKQEKSKTCKDPLIVTSSFESPQIGEKNSNTFSSSANDMIVDSGETDK